MKKNIIFTLLILLTLTFGVSIVSADDLRPKVREDIKELREKNRDDIKKVREDFQVTLKERKASTSLIIKEKRENMIQAVQEKREIFKDEIMSLREENKIKIEEKRTQLKNNLEVIKDEKKKIRIENVSKYISDLSVKFTAKSTTVIDKIEAALLAIESRTDKVNLTGVDVSAVRSLISSADTAIADARAALTNQISKTYTVTGTDEATIKTSLQSNRDLLKKDIEIVNTKIKAAHEAIRKAHNSLRVIPGVNASSTINTN
jgi:hypothetical protein